MALRRLASCAVVAAFVFAGCGGTYQDFYFPHVDQACKSNHGDDCWFLGEMWMGKASWSYYKSWSLPVDKAKARKAYLRGCELDSLRACAALVERHLVDDQPEQRAQVLARVQSLGGQVLSDEQVKQEDEALRAACEADVEQKSQAEREATQQALAQAASQLSAGMQQINGRLAEAEAKKAARNSRLASSRTPSSAPAGGSVARKNAAPVPTLTPNAPSGPKCTPNLGKGCNQLPCCEGRNMPGSMSLRDVDCENDMCCLGFGMTCTSAAECCNGRPLEVTCAPFRDTPSQSRCCIPKGGACKGHCELCCNGDDSAQHHGDFTMSTCM